MAAAARNWAKYVESNKAFFDAAKNATPEERQKVALLFGIAGAQGMAPSQMMAAEAADLEMTAALGGGEASQWVKVGRWMSVEELENMKATGVAQESPTLGGSRVAIPANPDAYKDAPKGSIYVEYQVPANSVKAAGSSWGRIPGPNSVEGRAAAAAGNPAPRMPPVKNITVVKSK